MRHIITDDTTRVESGALKINDDYAGLYIRGDDCFQLRIILGQILRGEGLTQWDRTTLECYFMEIDRNVLGHIWRKK